MSEDDSEITLTDGYSNPIDTNIQPTREPKRNTDKNSITGSIGHKKKQSIAAINLFFERAPINRFEATLITISFVIVNTIIAVYLSIYNVLGLISILTGVLILMSVHYSDTKSQIDSRYERVYYTLFGGIFIGIGLWYALMGFVFEYPL